MSERLAVAFFAGFLLVQILLPTWKLLEERPARFGWQMFSGIKSRPSFEILRSDGTTEPVRLAAWVGNPRGDLEYGDRLPGHLCAQLADVRAVRMTREGRAPEVRTCP